MNKKILIIGGAGMIGKTISKQLEADGLDATVMSSNPERARRRLGEQFPVVEGNVTKRETLSKPMEGQDYLYLHLSARFDPANYQRVEVEGTVNTVEAAIAAGIERIGIMSSAASTGEEQGVIYVDAKVLAEKAVMDSGIPYVIMRPSWFFEGLRLFVQDKGTGILGKQPIPRNWLSAGDYARQVSAAFRKDDAVNKCFYNYGPEQITTMEALKRFCGRHFPGIKPNQLGFTMARLMAKMPGMDQLKMAIPLFEYFETMQEAGDSSEADRILGPNETTLDQWLEAYQEEMPISC
jgi:uncharacterized protein YbjT (DUF2867 family)